MCEIDIKLVIEKLSTYGKEELEPTFTKQLKSYCKSLGTCQQDVNQLGLLILHQLEKNHAQIRYGSLLIIEYLFEKSHLFRIFICEHLESFFKLCFGLNGFNYFDKLIECNNSEKMNTKNINDKKKSLQPAVWRKKLHSKALECYLYWYREFSSAYKTLKNGFIFLQKQGLVDSDTFSNSSQLVNISDSKYVCTYFCFVFIFIFSV